MCSTRPRLSLVSSYGNGVLALGYLLLCSRDSHRFVLPGILLDTEPDRIPLCSLDLSEMNFLITDLNKRLYLPCLMPLFSVPHGLGRSLPALGQLPFLSQMLVPLVKISRKSQILGLFMSEVISREKMETHKQCFRLLSPTPSTCLAPIRSLCFSSCFC